MKSPACRGAACGASLRAMWKRRQRRHRSDRTTGFAENKSPNGARQVTSAGLRTSPMRLSSGGYNTTAQVRIMAPRDSGSVSMWYAGGKAGGRQEVTMTRRVDNYYCGITPLDGRHVLRSEDTDRKQQVDLINAANEVQPFLITASELRDRKNKRRQKRRAERPLKAGSAAAGV